MLRLATFFFVRFDGEIAKGTRSRARFGNPRARVRASRRNEVLCLARESLARFNLLAYGIKRLSKVCTLQRWTRSDNRVSSRFCLFFCFDACGAADKRRATSFRVAVLSPRVSALMDNSLIIIILLQSRYNARRSVLSFPRESHPFVQSARGCSVCAKRDAGRGGRFRRAALRENGRARDDFFQQGRGEQRKH